MSCIRNVLFVLDEKRLSCEEELWAVLRKSLYVLRKFSFKKNINLSVAFASLDGSGELLALHDFDTFAFEAEKRNSYFNFGIPALKDSFSSITTSYSQLVVFLSGGEGSVNPAQKEALFSQAAFKDALTINLNKSEWKNLPEKLNEAFSSKKNAVRSKFSKKNLIVASVSVAALCVLVALAILATSLLGSGSGGKAFGKKIVYKKVYTGDGDRLILRKEASLDSSEILRLNEGEAVVFVSEEDGFDKVSYHGFTGFVRSGWLVPAEKEEYPITDPDSMFAYGKACHLHNLEDVSPYEWIQKAACCGLIAAQWEMYRIYENGSSYEIQKDAEKASEYLELAYNNSVPYETKEAERFRASAKRFEAEGDKEAAKKFNSKADEKERTVKLTSRQVAKELSFANLGSDSSLASNYYKKALEYGLSGDADYMHSLAENLGFESDDGIWWLKKASELGKYESSLELGSYYFDRSKWDSSLYYFKAASKQNVGAVAPYSCAFIYYEKKSDYYSAVTWFKTAAAANDGSESYYLANYALGVCYEFGRGVSVDEYKALDYYAKARGHVSDADKSYKRLYKEIYDANNWW